MKQRSAALPTNVALLQNLVRRDPESYYEEFIQQYSHYQSLRDIFLANPTAHQGEEFSELIGFVSAVCGCYAKVTESFPQELAELLTQNHRELSPDLREKIIQCLTMLRNKGVVSAEFLIQTIFPLLSAYTSSTQGVQAKKLRRQVYSTLVTLLKSVNSGAKNQKLNKSTQALLFNLLEQQDTQGLWATKLTRELWRRGIWDDSRTVEIMTQAALHSDTKVCVSAARFFLGADKEREENFESDSDSDGVDLNALKHKMQVNKKSSKRGKKLEGAARSLKKKSSARHSATYLNFSAIHLLRDPQGFAESLFERHLAHKASAKLDLDQKIIFINLVSRLIGTHKLSVLGIYSFFLRYLTPKQRNVTQIMAAAAQASHDLVPPESLSLVIRKVADEFVSDGVAAEVAAAGINTIREILSRAPLAIEAPLLQDLTEYKNSKAKPVMMAARSLISLYREVAPELLLRKDRGKGASMEMQAGKKSALRFGVESNTVTSIPGLELLAKWKQENPDQQLAEPESDLESGSDSSNAGDWVNVSDEEQKSKAAQQKEQDSDSDLDLSDSEHPVPKRRKTEDVQVSESHKQAQELLSTSVLTAADFAKLEELRTQAGVEKAMGKKNEDEVDSATLTGPSKFKQLREERIAHAKEGKEDRGKFGSRKGNREGAHSTTNREKARKKNFVMTIHKRAVQGKAKMSLRDKQKVLKAHITKQKKKGY